MAFILNLETATTNCSVCLARNGQVLALREDNSPGYTHAEQLHLFMKEVLQEAGVGMADLNAVAVSRGPGSYTGLRIGVSAAKGICFALGIPLISLATLHSMSLQLKAEEGVLIPLLDARRMEVYSAVFSTAHEWLRETRAEIIGPESFGEYSAQGKVYLLGSGAEKCREVLKHPNFEFYTQILPSAREMAVGSFKAYEEEDFEDTAYFEPYYLKDFIAGGAYSKKGN